MHHKFLQTTSVVLFFFSCQLCNSNKLESLFECEVSRLLYDEGEVEYWMYEPVDLTEQSTTNAATGATMQGEANCTALPCFCVFIIQFKT